MYFDDKQSQHGFGMKQLEATYYIYNLEWELVKKYENKKANPDNEKLDESNAIFPLVSHQASFEWIE